MLVYTKKAEERAKKLGLEPRKQGTLAMFGHKPLELYSLKYDWIRKGYVEEVDQ